MQLENKHTSKVAIKLALLHHLTSSGGAVCDHRPCQARSLCINYAVPHQALSISSCAAQDHAALLAGQLNQFGFKAKLGPLSATQRSAGPGGSPTGTVRVMNTHHTQTYDASALKGSVPVPARNLCPAN